MAKQQTEKQQCKARIWIEYVGFRRCSRPAGHGLGGCFCKQHSEQGNKRQEDWLHSAVNAKRSEQRKAADTAVRVAKQIELLQQELASLSRQQAKIEQEIQQEIAELQKLIAGGSNG